MMQDARMTKSSWAAAGQNQNLRPFDSKAHEIVLATMWGMELHRANYANAEKPLSLYYRNSSSQPVLSKEQQNSLSSLTMLEAVVTE